VENGNNFVRSIEANEATDFCEGFFLESRGSDCVHSLNCEGVCILMNGTPCLAGSLSTETSAPSLIPTRVTINNATYSINSSSFSISEYSPFKDETILDNVDK